MPCAGQLEAKRAEFQKQTEELQRRAEKAEARAERLNSNVRAANKVLVEQYLRKLLVAFAAMEEAGQIMDMQPKCLKGWRKICEDMASEYREWHDDYKEEGLRHDWNETLLKFGMNTSV